MLVNIRRLSGAIFLITISISAVADEFNPRIRQVFVDDLDVLIVGAAQRCCLHLVIHPTQRVFSPPRCVVCASCA